MRALLARRPKTFLALPGRLAGWAVLGALAAGALPLGAQTITTEAQARIVNVGYATGRTSGNLLIEAKPDTAVLLVGSAKPRARGTTLIVTDTVIAVCREADGRLTVTGMLAVNNGGEYATQGLTMTVWVQAKARKQRRYANIAGAFQTITPATQLMPGETGQYAYAITFTPVQQATYRTRSTVTITNHSGYIGTPFGPETGADFPAGPYARCGATGKTALGSGEAAVMEAQPAASLSVQLETDRLEALAGEMIPLTGGVQNESSIAVEHPIARLALPAGLGYVTGSISGADSVRQQGNELEVFLARLEPGAVRQFQLRVAVLGAGAANLDIRLAATAAEGGTESDVASVAVSTRRNRATETRSLIGKVWIDANRNGRQDAGERGVADVDIWSSDGSIATTDSTGKFSFPELRLGAHAMRVDPASVSPEFGVPASSRNGVMVQVDGWTTPHVLLPLTSREGQVKELRVAVRPVFLDPGYCQWVGQELGSAGAATPSGCEPVQVASREIDPGSSVPAIDVTLIPPAGSDEASYRIRDGWELIRDRRASRPGPTAARSIRDRAGNRWAVAKVDPRRGAATIRLRAVGGDRPEPVRVSAIRTVRTPEERERRRLVSGPPVEIFAPQDGAVVGTDRIYVGVRGEPGTEVVLFDGDRELRRGTVRIDGQLDFASVDVKPGPHILRARMKNTWNFEHWDSVHVHGSGAPATLSPEHDEVTIPADPRAPALVRVRVLDEWGVPVVNRPVVTVAGAELEMASPDDDRSSTGLQVRADTTGWLNVTFTPPREIGRGTIDMAAGDAATSVALDFVTAMRALLVVAGGQVGFGATRGAEGSLTVRGNITPTTALTVSVDSRGRDATDPRFGNVTDPLGEGVLPIIGDAGEQRFVGSNGGHLSVRLERGLRYAEFGDIRMDRTLDGLTLLRHQRSVRGFSGETQAFGFELAGFGALTGQSLQQVQLRGAGTSGPYELGGRVLAGTEQVNVEVRDPENAQHLLSRQRLSAFMDYEIDYERGVLLLKQPLPAIDMSGNPLFLVVSYEQDGGGPRQGVWGLRARRNFLERRGTGGTRDSIAAGLTYIRDDQVALGGLQLIGSDVRVALGKKLALSGEVVYADQRDSSDVAMAVEGKYKPLGERLTLGARWSSTGREFRNPADLSRIPGTQDLRLNATAQIRNGKLQLEHSAQSFANDSTRRQRTSLGVTQPLGHGLELVSMMSDDNYTGGPTRQRGGIGETKLAWRPTPRVRLWAEARRQLWSIGENMPWADHFGGGGALTLFKDLTLEARHLKVTASDSIHYTTTELGLRSTLNEGSRAWGSYQITGGVSGASNAAIVGLSNRFPLSKALTLNTLLERRAGVLRSSVSDPVRAQPYGQPENDYWAGGLGLELRPKDGTYQASARSEVKRGLAESSDLLILAGDVALNRSVAILARHDYIARRRTDGTTFDRSGRNATILGLAVRPAMSNTFNALFQFRMLEDARPASGGVLSQFGRERRVLGSAEAIWTPSSGVELGARCATRATRAVAMDSMPALESRATFCSGRYEFGIARRLLLRGESRILQEQLSQMQRWDFAPALVFRTESGFEAGGGYRLGTLRDPDFARDGGGGWFFTLGARASEGTAFSAAEYWRDLMGRE